MQQVHLPDGTVSTVGVRSGVDVPYVFTGSLSTSTSPPVRPHKAFVATGLSACLGTAGTSNSVIQLLKNGVSVASVTVASGTLYNRVAFASVTYISDVDSFQISVTTAGTGAANLGGVIETAP